MDTEGITMKIERVFVVGSGLMGNGITQVSAQAGYKVKMNDVKQEFCERGLEAIKSSLGKFLQKEKISQDHHDAALTNITTTTRLEDAADADLVVEAVFEDLEVKREVFGKLDQVCRPDTILATNTSAIPISLIAGATQRVDKVVGTHFFSPVPLMRLCEIIKGVQTSDETVSAAKDWAESVGKTTVVVKKDHAGFIANRLGLPMSLEAIRMLEAGVADPEDIDNAMKFGFNHPMGPLELADFTGIDILMNASLAIYNDTQDPKYFPPPLMQRMVASGLCGRKTGKGFYDYNSGKKQNYWQT
jgi:3-hydroxybutyryl-CoA dehydrogenase